MMSCPECNAKTTVIDGSNNFNENELYRKRKCLNCGKTYYTIESIVSPYWEKDFVKDLWRKYYRRTGKAQNGGE